jgi:hypothetical protein
MGIVGMGFERARASTIDSRPWTRNREKPIAVPGINRVWQMSQSVLARGLLSLARHQESRQQEWTMDSIDGRRLIFV